MFIGDGALNYRPESIFEGYYSINLFKGGWLTPDYQFILNPTTVNQLFLQYRLTEQGLVTLPGLLECQSFA